MRTLIIGFIYMLVLPFLLAWVNDDELGEYPLSLWVCVFEFVFLVLVIRQNWFVRITVGVIAGVVFPVVSEILGEILMDKGEGPLKMFSIDLVAYVFLYSQTLLLLFLVERIRNNREVVSDEKQ